TPRLRRGRAAAHVPFLPARAREVRREARLRVRPRHLPRRDLRRARERHVPLDALARGGRHLARLLPPRPEPPPGDGAAGGQGDRRRRLQHALGAAPEALGDPRRRVPEARVTALFLLVLATVLFLGWGPGHHLEFAERVHRRRREMLPNDVAALVAE